MTDNTTENTVQNCEFPAFFLRSYRRELVAEITRIEKAGEPGEPRCRAILQVVLGVDRLRQDHEEIDGCKCWYTPSDLAKHRALDEYVERHKRRGA